MKLFTVITICLSLLIGTIGCAHKPVAKSNVAKVECKVQKKHEHKKCHKHKHPTTQKVKPATKA